MKIIFKVLLTSSVLASITPALAQTPTQKVPMCLQVQQGNKYYVPCTGVVPVDTATGNALSWSDILSGRIAGAGTISDKATPVQNADGTKVASDAQLINAVNQLTTVVSKLSTLITATGAPFQAGGSISNTGFAINGTLPGFAATPTVNVGTLPSVTVSGSTLPTGAATDASSQAIKTAIGNPYQAGGALPLPAGAATDAQLVNAVSQLSTIVTKLSNTLSVNGSVNVGNLPATQAVNGTVVANLGTLNGAATSAKQDALITVMGNPLQSGGTVSVSNLPATQPVSGTVNVGTLPSVSVGSSALPAGAATAVLQNTINSTLGTLATSSGQVAMNTTLATLAKAPVAAVSTPATGTVTTTALTTTSGTAGVFNNGIATIPFTAQIGLPIRLITRVTSGGGFTAYVGTSIDGCTTVNPLTIAGQQWATFTGPEDEYIDTPVTTVTTAGITYCAVITPSSGTVTYALRQ